MSPAILETTNPFPKHRCHQCFLCYFTNPDGVTQNTSNAKIPNLFLNNQKNDMLQECNPKLTECVCWRSVWGGEGAGLKQTLQFCSFQLNRLGVIDIVSSHTLLVFVYCCLSAVVLAALFPNTQTSNLWLYSVYTSVTSCISWSH